MKVIISLNIGRENFLSSKKIRSCHLILPLQIEKWWRELHEQVEKYYKDQLRWLKDQGYYDPNDETDRYVDIITLHVLLKMNIQVM